MVLIAVALAACGSSTPTQPTSVSIAGNWTGSLVGRTPCVGDWSGVALAMEASGRGSATTADGQRFTAAEVTSDGVRRIEITLPPGAGECTTFALVINNVEVGASARATAFSGSISGRCCGTLQATFRFVRL